MASHSAVKCTLKEKEKTKVTKDIYSVAIPQNHVLFYSLFSSAEDAFEEQRVGHESMTTPTMKVYDLLMVALNQSSRLQTMIYGKYTSGTVYYNKVVEYKVILKLELVRFLGILYNHLQVILKEYETKCPKTFEVHTIRMYFDVLYNPLIDAMNTREELTDLRKEYEVWMTSFSENVYLPLKEKVI